MDTILITCPKNHKRTMERLPTIEKFLGWKVDVLMNANDTTSRIWLSKCKIETPCEVGHFRAVQYAYDMGLDQVMILEDDTIFNKYLFHKCLDAKPSDADVSIFGWWVNGVWYESDLNTNRLNEVRKEVMSFSKPVNEFWIEQASTTFGSQCYVLSRKGMEKVLEVSRILPHPPILSDGALSKGWVNGCKVYHTNCPATLQEFDDTNDKLHGFSARAMALNWNAKRNDYI